MFHLVFESPWWKGLGAESEEKRGPVSDIDTGLVVSLKVLDPDGRLEKRTKSRHVGTSALCQKQTFALQQICLFNHLVGAGEQRRGHVSSGVVRYNIQVAVETGHISSLRTM